MISKEIVYEGKQFTIWAITINGKCIVRDFIDGLVESEKKKVITLLQRAGDYGPPSNKEKFNHLGNGIFEFKSYQVRIFCALERGKLILLTHGFIKKGRKTPKRQIEKAERLLKSLED